jgi:hypothetical protein
VLSRNAVATAAGLGKTSHISAQNGIHHAGLSQNAGFHANTWPISSIITHCCTNHGDHYFLNQKSWELGCPNLRHTHTTSGLKPAHVEMKGWQRCQMRRFHLVCRNGCRNDGQGNGVNVFLSFYLSIYIYTFIFIYIYHIYHQISRGERFLPKLYSEATATYHY